MWPNYNYWCFLLNIWVFGPCSICTVLEVRSFIQTIRRGRCQLDAFLHHMFDTLLWWFPIQILELFKAIYWKVFWRLEWIVYNPMSTVPKIKFKWEKKHKLNPKNYFYHYAKSAEANHLFLSYKYTVIEVVYN